MSTSLEVFCGWGVVGIWGSWLILKSGLVLGITKASCACCQCSFSPLNLHLTAITTKVIMDIISSLGY